MRNGVATGQAVDLKPAAVSGDRLPVVLALLSVYIIWGSTYLAIKLSLVGGFPPFLMAGLRFLIAGGALYLFLRARGTPNPVGRQWLGAVIVGCLLLVGGNGGVVFGQQWVSSSLAALVVASVPIWAALFAGVWGRWPNRLEWVGLILGIVGVALLNLESDLQANPLGAASVLLATMSWAFGSIWSRRLPLPPGLMGSAVEMLAGGAVLLMLSLLSGERITRPITEQAIWALAYLVVFGSLVAYSAYTYLLRRVRPALATSYAYVNPVVAVMLGVGLVGEQITEFGLAGMAVILTAVALVMLGRERAAPLPAKESE